MADTNTTTPGSTGAFATVDDLAARWHSLSAAESSTATALLEDASDVIRTTAPGWVRASASTLKRIACAMVKRAMVAGDNVGLSQATETTGPFSNSWTFSNPGGDLYLTRSERKALGIGQATGSAVPRFAADSTTRPQSGPVSFGVDANGDLFYTVDDDGSGSPTPKGGSLWPALDDDGDLTMEEQ